MTSGGGRPRLILALDEATSNLDAATDEKMQKLLRTEFKDLTLLTIAHRLHTIIDYEQVPLLRLAMRKQG